MRHAGGGDSRDRDDVWRRLGAAGNKGRGQRRRGGFGFISLFSIMRITLEFFSLPLQVKPQDKNARSFAAGGRARLRIM
jgi:hypothetical protein